jgi:hypothetical protein
LTIMRKVKLMVVCVAVVLANMMCYSGEAQPLEADCIDESFLLRGEITSYWEAEVEPDTGYEVILSEPPVSPSINHLTYIRVVDAERNILPGYPNDQTGETPFYFESDVHDRVVIAVWTVIGDGDKVAGEFQIRLCEVDSQ